VIYQSDRDGYSEFGRKFARPASPGPSESSHPASSTKLVQVLATLAGCDRRRDSQIFFHPFARIHIGDVLGRCAKPVSAAATSESVRILWPDRLPRFRNPAKLFGSAILCIFARRMLGRQHASSALGGGGHPPSPDAPPLLKGAAPAGLGFSPEAYDYHGQCSQ